MTSPARALAGWVAKRSATPPPPVTVVVRAVGGPVTSVRSFPGGPLKALLCFASTVQLDAPAVQGARATIVASSAWPGCTARPRRLTFCPETLAVAGAGTEAETTV